MTQNVPEKVHLASLPADSLKMSLNPAFLSPLWSSETTRSTPHTPRPLRSRSISSQEASFSLSPNVSLRISRCPSSDIRSRSRRPVNHAVVLSHMLVPGRKTRGQGAHRGLRKLRSTQLFRNARHPPGRDSLDHHLHQRQNQALFRALIASEQLRRKTSVPGLGNPKDQRSNPGRQLSFPVFV